MKQTMQALTPQPVRIPASAMAVEPLAGRVASPTLPTALPISNPLELAEPFRLARAAELAQKWELSGGAPTPGPSA